MRLNSFSSYPIKSGAARRLRCSYITVGNIYRETTIQISGYGRNSKIDLNKFQVGIPGKLAAWAALFPK